MTHSVIDTWVKDNYGNLQDIAKKISGGDPIWEDALSYSILSFLQKKNIDKIIESGGGTFYIVSILLRSMRSKTNDFYRMYKQQNLPLIDNIVDDPGEDQSFSGLTDEVVMKYLDGLYWYEREVFLTYHNGNYTYKKLSEETGISRTSLQTTNMKVKNYLKNKIKDEINRRH